MRGPFPKPPKRVVFGQPQVNRYKYSTPRRQDISVPETLANLEKEVVRMWGDLLSKDKNAFAAIEDVRQGWSAGQRRYHATAVYYVYEGSWHRR